jgi:hypothetical protein
MQQARTVATVEDRTGRFVPFMTTFNSRIQVLKDQVPFKEGDRVHILGVECSGHFLKIREWAKPLATERFNLTEDQEDAVNKEAARQKATRISSA